MRLWRRSTRTLRRASPYDLELEVPDVGVLRLDHLCPASEMHRLLGIELTDGEREALRDAERVAVVASCDQCLWERRLVLRLVR